MELDGHFGTCPSAVGLSGSALQVQLLKFFCVLAT